MRSRSVSRKFWTPQIMTELDVVNKMNHIIDQAVDAGYCEGYNTVLDGMEKVFGINSEEYWKLVNYLNTLDEDE